MSIKNILILVFVLALIGGSVFYLLNRGDVASIVSVDKEKSVFKISNTSEYTYSPGLFIIHNAGFNSNYINVSAPSSMERFAEVGNPSEYREYLENNFGDEIYEIVDVTGETKPGEKIEIDLEDLPENSLITFFSMIVESNDALVWVNQWPIHDFETGERNEYRRISLNAIDAGFEDNSPIGSGFEGGQPDPTKGEANIDNGVEVRENVRYHPDILSAGSLSLEVVEK